MKIEIVRYEERFNQLLPEEYNQTFPPNDCKDLNQKIQNLNALIGKIYIFLKDQKRDAKNIIYLIDMYLKNILENFEAIKYERKKAV